VTNDDDDDDDDNCTYQEMEGIRQNLIL